MNHDSPDFDAIMPAFREGDRDAFRAVYEKTCPPLTSFVETIINDSKETDNIVSDVYVDLFQVCNTMETFDSTKKWLYAQAGKYTKKYLLAKKENSEEIARALDDRLETESVKMNALSMVLEELSKLPGNQEDILRMYFIERKSVAEIGALLRNNGSQN